MNVRNQMYGGQDGEQALAFLAPTEPYCRAPRPELDLVGSEPAQKKIWM